jgi:hypothetical protein
MPTSKRKPLPSFASEDQERAFWATHDSSHYVDWSMAQRRSFPNLKPTLRTIVSSVDGNKRVGQLPR